MGSGLTARPAGPTLLVLVLVLVTSLHSSNGTLAVVLLLVLLENRGQGARLQGTPADVQVKLGEGLKVFSLLLTTSSASQPQARLQVEFTAVGKK